MNGDPLDELDEQAEEIARLRLTVDEESAIRGALGWLLWCDQNSHLGDEGRKDIATLRGLLERTK